MLTVTVTLRTTEGTDVELNYAAGTDAVGAMVAVGQALRDQSNVVRVTVENVDVTTPTLADILGERGTVEGPGDFRATR
jgi:hypothetical protein